MIKIVVIFFLFLLDFFSKQWIITNINFVNIFPITFFLDLVYVQNSGISFGLFAESVSSWVLIFIGSLVTFIIFYMMLCSKNLIEKWGFIMIIAGALSNIIDRIINGYVVDFIFLNYIDFYWPAFNFADIYITIGIILIIIQLLRDVQMRIFK